MIVLIQRVSSASVSLIKDPLQKRQIKLGYCVFVAIAPQDTVGDVEKIASKLANTRLMADGNDKMNLNIKSVSGEILLISQFTLLAKTSPGNRPGFTATASPEKAEKTYLLLAEKLSGMDIKVKIGYFGQHMNVKINNDGPVTIILDSYAL